MQRYRGSRVPIEANKTVVRRCYEEVINGRGLDAIERLPTEGFRHDGEVLGFPIDQLGRSS
jgi:hypothetical protein